MTRKKVKLAFISNDSARKATFKKRKKGLMKKVSELSTLCGIEACAVIYSPYDSQPEVWPSPLEAQRVATKFKGLPEMEQSKKMVNHESFLRQRVLKAAEQLKKQRKDNREKEVTQVMFQAVTGKSFHNLTMLDLNDLGWVVDQYLKEIYKRIESLNKVSHNAQPSQLAIASTPLLNVDHQRIDTQQIENNRLALDPLNMDSMQRQPWFMDLMNPHDHLGFGGFVGDDVVLPFGDNNSNPHWSNAIFP